MATRTTPFTSAGANLVDGDRAAQASRASRCLHDLDGVQSRSRVDRRRSLIATRVEEYRDLELQRLVAADGQLFLPAIDGLPRGALLHVLARVQRGDAGAVIGNQTTALADDDTFPLGAGNEVVGLDDDRHVTVGDGDE